MNELNNDLQPITSPITFYGHQHVVKRTMTVRDFGESGVEIFCKRHDITTPSIDELKNRSLTPRAKRGESSNREKSIESATERARTAVRHKCKTILADRMITLTTRQNYDIEQFKKLFKDFSRRLKKYQEFKYVAVMELQERGAPHLHIAVKGRQNYRLLIAVWWSVVGKGEGAAHVQNPKMKKKQGKLQRHRIASYLSKYIGKAFEEGELNSKRYWASKGIEIPQSNPHQLCPWSDDIGMIAEAYEYIREHGLKNPKWWWNEDLGIFWLSATP